MRKLIVSSTILLALTAACSMPEDDNIDSGTHAFNEKGNGKQNKQGAPAQKQQDSGLSAAQENAVGAAQDYLDYSAFSRSGLIRQLKYEKYSVKDATFAVDHITVNWNAQAARSAKDYLDNSSFSRQSLIDQLKYEGYTPAQAAYGATQAGL